MGVKGVYGKGPIDISRHNELADAAADKARAASDPDQKRSLENLVIQHRQIVGIEKARRRTGKGSG